MIDRNGFCGHCRTYHRPDPRYWNDCPHPFTPVPRDPQPTLEEQHTAAMRATEQRIADENRAR